MSRKSFFLTIGIVVALVSTAATVLVIMVRHEPAFYKRAAVPPGERRTKESGDFFSISLNEVTNSLLNSKSGKREFDARFTEEQINSYLAEDWICKHSGDKPFPDGVSDVRIALDADHIRVGFRYGTGWTSTVVSLDLHVWLVTKETNVVALKFEKIHAGALPISAHSLLESIADFAHQKQDIEPTWYRHQGRPVLLLRFQADRSNPDFQLLQLELRPGLLRIVGKSLEGAWNTGTGG